MLGDEDKFWDTHTVWKICVESLRQWTNQKRKCLKFRVPIVWRESKNHHDDCYFCSVNVKGFIRHKKGKWEYPNLKSARRPIPHNEEIPVLVCITLSDVSMSEVEEIDDQYSNSSKHEYEEMQSSP